MTTSSYKQETIEQFRDWVELAESGDLQSAVKKIGPINLNPYYSENPLMANSVAYFLGRIVPLAQSRYSEDPQSTFTLEEAITDERIQVVNYMQIKTVELADKSGYLICEDNNEEDFLQSKYSPARMCLELDSVDVFSTKFDSPDSRGCLTGFGGGLVGSMVVFSQVDVPPITKVPLTMLGFFSGAGYGMVAGKNYGKFRAGRQAYKHYTTEDK